MIQLNKVDGLTGYLVMNEDGAVFSSFGDLENDEKRAILINNIISLTDSIDPAVFPKHSCRKLSISFENFAYTICMNNKKIYVVKRSLNRSGGSSSGGGGNNL